MNKSTTTDAPPVAGLPRYVTVQRVAKMLDASPEAVYGWAKNGTLPNLRRCGRKRLFRSDQLTAAIEKMEADAEAVEGGSRQ